MGVNKVGLALIVIRPGEFEVSQKEGRKESWKIRVVRVVRVVRGSSFIPVFIPRLQRLNSIAPLTWAVGQAFSLRAFGAECNEQLVLLWLLCLLQDPVGHGLQCSGRDSFLDLAVFRWQTGLGCLEEMIQARQQHHGVVFVAAFL